MGDDRWNLNIASHRRILDVVPGGARTAIDLGCGEGLLAFDLADSGLDVVGLDRHVLSVERARSDLRAGDRTSFVVCDMLDHPFRPASFDVVTSIAALHHVDTERALGRVRELVRPGGVVAFVTFARASSPGDVARAVRGSAVSRVRRAQGRWWDHASPLVWPPALRSRDLARLVERELPGASFRPGLGARFEVTWTAPR